MSSPRTTAAVAGALGVVALLLVPLANPAAAQCPGCGGGHQMMGDRSHQADMQGFHYLLEHRAKITRAVTNLDNGIDTTTKSADPEVASQLRIHVAAMAKRMEEGRPIHVRDPFFAEMFRNAKHVTIKIEPLPDGVRVIETSDDGYTVKLLREHAKIVDGFLQNGISEMHRDHAVPPRK